MRAILSLLLVTVVSCTGNAWGAGKRGILIYPQVEMSYIMHAELPRIGIWGEELTYPAPILLVLSSTARASLQDPYYFQCGNDLVKKGFLCVSIDLPGHDSFKGEDSQPGLVAWREASDRGEDFVASFTGQVKGVLDFLIEAGYADPNRIAACGTSRGGFMALHAAAADPRIKAVAAFAPVTNLMALREFDGAKNVEHVAGLSLFSNAEKLAGRSLWLVIGDRDDRVSTDDAIALSRKVTSLSLEKSSDADVTLLVLPEQKGHTTPKGAPELAAAWIAEKLK